MPMPSWVEIAWLLIGLGGLTLAIVAFYIGSKRHKEAMKALADRSQDAADRHG